MNSDFLRPRYQYGVHPVVHIHHTRINNEDYYIAETSEGVDFEFKGNKAVKMWDVKEEKTYFPSTFQKWINDPDNMLCGLYYQAERALNLYHSNYNRYHNEMKQRTSILNSLDNVNKKNEHLRVPSLSLYKGYRYNPPYIVKSNDGRCINEAGFLDLNDARKMCIENIWVNGRWKIYKKTETRYEYVGSVELNKIGRYDTMIYFANKNGAFRMDTKGRLTGALYRW